MEQIHYEEWILAASMGPKVVFIEDVQLRMSDLDISHNWAEDLDRYLNIEIDRKWVHTHYVGDKSRPWSQYITRLFFHFISCLINN